MTPGKLSAKHMREPKHSMDHPPKINVPTTLYRMYDAEDRLLYVGITSNRARRWDGHRKVSSWWKQVVRKDFTVYPDRVAAVEAEELAVRTEKPIHNVEYTHPKNPKVVGVTLYPAQMAKLEQLADVAGKSIAAIIRQLVDDHA